MKLISKFLNLLMMCILFCMSTVVEWSVYNLIALPAGQTSTIGITEEDKNNDGYADNVTYFDTFTFLADDLSKSVTREPRFVIRSWFKWDWWQNGMRLADVALEAVVGATVPIFAPVYEIREIQFYYTGEQPVVETICNGQYTVHGLVKITDMEYDEFNTASENYNAEFVESFEATYHTQFAYVELTSDSEVLGGRIYRIANGQVYVDAAGKNYIAHWNTCGTAENFTSSEWKKENSKFINELLYINKYNDVDESGKNVYTKWVKKFMEDDTAKTIKSSACSLYFQFYLAVILSIWFTYQNPIVIRRNEYGEDEVSGGFRRHVPKEKKKGFFHRKKKGEE